jgi:hypothetical protein
MDFMEWKVIHQYTRKDMLEDGSLVDVSELAREAGILFPVAVTRAVWEGVVKPNSREAEEFGQSIEGRLWDVLFLFQTAAARNSTNELLYACYILRAAAKGRFRHELVRLKAVCGPGDQLEPVITIMLPEED